MDKIRTVLIKESDYTQDLIDNIDLLKNKSITNHFEQDLSWWNDSDTIAFLFVTRNGKEIVCVSVAQMRKSRVFPGKKVVNIARGPRALNCHYLKIHLLDIITLTKNYALQITINPYAYGEVAKEIEQELTKIGFKKKKKLMTDSYEYTVLVDIQNSIEHITRNFRDSLRRQIAKAETNDLISIKYAGNCKDYLNFINDYNNMAIGMGLKTINDFVTRKIYEDYIKKNKSIVILALYKKKIVAGIMLMDGVDKLVYECGFSLRDKQYRKLPLSHMLHFEAIKWAKKNGYKLYDMGGYWADKGNKNLINRFKTGFSKNIINVVPQYTIYRKSCLGQMLNFLHVIKLLMLSLKHGIHLFRQGFVL